MGTVQTMAVELRLKTTFRIAHGASDTRRNVLLRIGDGWGEAAPVVYHGEDASKVLAFLQDQRPLLESANEPEAIKRVLDQLTGSAATRAAVDLALFDRLGKFEGRNVCAILGLTGQPIPPTSFTLPLAEAADLRQQAQAAAVYPILKIKLGGPADLASVAIIREAAPKSALRVDANAGWGRETARQLIPALIEYGVELIEQPLPAADKEGYALLQREHYAIPIFADEPIKTAADVLEWAALVDGVNIKLMKAGGILGAQAALTAARAAGLQVMLGCMIETSLGAAAAVALAGLADLLDLDGPLLIANDPFDGLRYTGSTISPLTAPGLGVALDEARLERCRID